ncbi:ring-1,2-phenylacetyl-CoA epoxidase subunit PaaC [Novosphingobium sp. 1529]|uniref:1,2-phenylacetyl-CoA epoxidase subunit PaaC n=1 Tax=Novosphingobium sp. 1529 TaxID=3156424 RepID=UPI00145A6F1C
MNDALFHAALLLGDDCLILAQRLCEWSGHAPTIEVDLSLSNIGLDLLGQATMLLEYAGEIEGAGRNGDRLAFHRDAGDFRNAMLVEQPNGDFGRTMIRQLLFSAYSSVVFDMLTTSADARLAEIAAKATKETRYHLDYARDWVVRLGDGTAESHARIVDGLDWMYRFVDDLFVWGDSAQLLVQQGILPDPEAIRARFEAIVAETLGLARVAAPRVGRPLTGGRSGLHTEHLSTMLATMQVLPRAHPEAVW